MFDLSEVKKTIYAKNNGHLILDLDEISLTNEWLIRFDPESTLKRRPKLSRSDEDKIITALAMIATRKNDDTVNDNIYVTSSLIKEIETLTNLSNSYEYIEEFLLKIYKSIDEADDDENDQQIIDYNDNIND